MKKIYVLVLILVVAILATAVSGDRPGRIQRGKYTTFLQKAKEKLPRHFKQNKNEFAADQPDAAAIQEYFMTLDPRTGTVPRERLLAAYEQTRKLQQGKSDPLNLQWTGYEADMGGRTRAVMFDPNDAAHKKVWAGGVTGGLWYNPDISSAASAWVPTTDFSNNMSIRCITYDPNNTQTFYLGTGEVETALQTYRESSGLGDGIWKSADGGQTWDVLPGTVGFVYVTDIQVRIESGSSVIYAGVASGLYEGQQHPSSPSDGLFRSTDGGITWLQVLPLIPGHTVPFSVSDIALGADGRIYVGTRPNLDGNGAATMLFSDTGLPGSWTVNESYRIEIENMAVYSIPGRVVMATAASDANVVYALIASGYTNPANNFNYFNCHHILRSSDKGNTWITKSQPNDLTSGDNFATIAWHALDIAVDPNSPNSLYIGGLDMHKSTNGGDSWNRVSNWAEMYYGGGPDYLHADQHIIVYEPSSSTHMLFGTDGGVFYTANGTATQPVFEERNKNYTTLQFYTCAINPIPGTQEYLGGLQDNGTLRYTGHPLTINDMVSGGDGAYCFYDELDAGTSITSVYYNDYIVYLNGSYYQEYGFSSGIFVNPADYDYKLKKLYANAVDFIGTNSDEILRINIPNLFTYTSFQMLTGSSAWFSAIKYSPHSPTGQTTLFVGTQEGRLFRVNHAESSSVRTEITGSSFPAANISSIAIGGSDDTLMVTFSNYGVPSVWQTVDGGQNWNDVEGNLPDMPIRWALYQPQTSKIALLATETGVWESTNLDQADVTWQPAVDGMANVRVDMLKLRSSDNTVIAATHGRGLFTTTFDVSTGIKKINGEEFRIFPNPSHGIVNISGGLKGTTGLRVRVQDATGKIIADELTPGSAGSFQRQIDLSGKPAGIYYISLVQGKKVVSSEKVIVY